MYNASDEKPREKTIKISGLGLGLMGCSVSAVVIAVIGAATALFMARGCHQEVKDEFFAHIGESRKRNEIVLLERSSSEVIHRTVAPVKIPIPWTLKEIDLSQISNPAELNISFKATYFYVVSAEPEKWSMDLSDGTLHVHAPKLEVLKPPSVHTDTVKTFYKGKICVVGETQELEKLEKDLSNEAARLALDHRHLNNARRECRDSLKELIAKVLKHRGHSVENIKVTFADEASPAKKNGAGKPKL
jgi:hypothetical protein